MNEDIVIKAQSVSKTFRIPHEKVNSLRGAAISAFKKRSYEEFKALDNVSFDIKKGEFFGVIGRNGSGKSTLLKILAGIYKPDKEKVTINGMISPFLELGIGFNPELSGRDNVYLNATVLGMSKKQIDEKFDDIVKFSELERFIDQKLKNYSSGMQVRLAFSVSIHANRDILLMDEVLAVGDGNFQKKCINVFRSYRSSGKTVILVTHDIASVRKYCSRAMLLHNGSIVKIGDVDEVCDEYVLKNIAEDNDAQFVLKKKEGEENRERMLRAKRDDKPQVIIDVLVNGQNGKELLSTKRGETFYVDVIADIREFGKKKMYLSVQIWGMDDYFVSGNNTHIDKYDCKWRIGRNMVRVTFKDHRLNYGEFYVKAVLFENEDEKMVELDSFSTRENSYYFIAERKDSAFGTMHIDHKWEKIDGKN